MTEAERATLDQAYRRARYRVDGPQGTFLLVADEYAPEADAVLTAQGQAVWALLTAYNPRSMPTDTETNRANQQQLETELAKGGYVCFPGAGLDPDGKWPAEPSVWVLGMVPEAAAGLAARYGQNALLLGRRGGRVRLHWCC